MFRLKRKSRTEKVTEALKDAASYADQLVHDRRLRSDLRSAGGHGTHALQRLQRDLRHRRGVSRATGDEKLRKSLRAFVDDVTRASSRVQRKKSHRVRNALLLLGGTGAAIAAGTEARRRLDRRGHAPQPPVAAPAH